MQLMTVGVLVWDGGKDALAYMSSKHPQSQILIPDTPSGPSCLSASVCKLQTHNQIKPLSHMTLDDFLEHRW